jgi:signal transduction histidine kinase
LINILLNAAQAIDHIANKSASDEIKISVRKIALRKTLRDFSFIDENENKEGKSIGKEIVLKKGIECALIEIADSGSGVERSHLKRIFDPFFTTKPNGTGLGLPMVKRTVNAHNGIITVSSRKGKGTKFSIYLPLNSRRN